MCIRDSTDTGSLLFLGVTLCLCLRFSRLRLALCLELSRLRVLLTLVK